MAGNYPWDVRSSQQKWSWLYFFFLLSLYFAYCIITTVQAFQARRSPPVSLRYDASSPITLPDISFIINLGDETENHDPKYEFVACCQVYTEVSPLARTFINQSHTPYLFSALDPARSWDGELWNSSVILNGPANSPAEPNTAFQPMIKYCQSGSICPIMCNYTTADGPLTITFLLSRIAYHGDYTEDNIFNIEWYNPGEPYIRILQGPKIQPVFVSPYGYSSLVLSHVVSSYPSRSRTQGLLQGRFELHQAGRYRQPDYNLSRDGPTGNPFGTADRPR